MRGRRWLTGGVLALGLSAGRLTAAGADPADRVLVLDPEHSSIEVMVHATLDTFMGRLEKFRNKRCGCATVALSVLAIGAASQAMAADMPVKAGSSTPVPMAVGGWLFSPSIFAGAVYNSNVNQTEAKVSSWGERVVPAFTASLNNGIHQTSLYGLADVQNYSNSDATRKTTIDAKAGRKGGGQ